MTNDIPQRFQAVLTKKNNDNKINIGFLDSRFINEPINDNLDVNNNRIMNVKDAENEFDAINKIQLDFYVKSLDTKFAKAHDQQKLEFTKLLQDSAKLQEDSLSNKEKDLLTKIRLSEAS